VNNTDFFTFQYKFNNPRERTFYWFENFLGLYFQSIKIVIGEEEVKNM